VAPEDPAGGSTPRSRWTLALTVAGSVVLLSATVLVLRHEAGKADPEPTVAPAGPWQPPSAAPVETGPVIVGSPPATRPATTVPTTRPATKPATTPPATPATTSPAARVNLSLVATAGADGSGKADGSRFGNVRDGDLDTFWSPAGTTGTISIKWSTPVTVSRVVIRQSGASIGSWRLRDNDSDAVLARGSGTVAVTFSPVTLSKIDLEILSASGTPRVTEFQTF